MNTRLRVCAMCGRDFHDRQASTIRQKYCSGTCYGQARRARITKTYPPREEIAALYAQKMTDRQVGRRYGHTCVWAMSVRRHYGIPGRRRGSWARKPLKQKTDRARWGIHRKPAKSCRNCGAAAAEGTLDLHHAIPRSLSKAAKFDLRNGVQLCDRCHMGWHHKRIVIYREIFTPQEWAFISTVKLLDRDVTAWLDKHYPPRSSA